MRFLGRGASKTNRTNYRFGREGETRLTEWMKANLLYDHVPLADGAAIVERDLIADLRPPLKLTGWKNPQRKLLMDLRRVCADEARARRLRSRDGSQ